MIGLATDNAAKRNRALIGPPRARRRVQRNDNGRRDFQRARHADDIAACARRGKGRLRARQQLGTDGIVEACLNNQEACRGDAGRRVFSCTLWRGHGA